MVALSLKKQACKVNQIYLAKLAIGKEKHGGI